MPNQLSEYIYRFRWQASLLLIGLILTASGVFLARSSFFKNTEIEVLETKDTQDLVIEVAGSVASPGVYQMTPGSRVEDAIIKAGGMTSSADLIWVEKTLNRASKLIDGQKIYIPSHSEQSQAESAKNSGGSLGVSDESSTSDNLLVNINTASQKELESLWGIGPVTAQNIIEQRPYSSVEELLSKKILKANVYEKNKDHLSVY